MIGKEEAILRVTPEQIDQLLHPTFDPAEEERATQLTKGLPASPGAATGTVVFSAEEAEEAAKEGKKVILVRIETSPEDIGGMNAAEGILTARGGMTSHAAVVARGMGKCCVAGAGGLVIDYVAGKFSIGGHTVRAGDAISLNGSTGVVYLGRSQRSVRSYPATSEPSLTGPMRSGDWGCAPTPILRTMPQRRSSSELRESASAALSTCSSKAIGSSPCAR